MGDKESFNKGVETGIRIAEGIVKKEVEAMTYLENKIDTMSSMQEEVRSVVNGILEYQNSEAIEKYYGICNMLNPRDLEDAEKTVLLNVLATLAYKLKDDYTNNQKRYYLNLKRYISLANFVPDTNYSFGLVENIRDLDFQEIILKCVREFLFLENNDFSFEEKYSELFELFSINKKTIKKIDLWIDITYTLLTENGIVEMYGLHKMENIELENTEVLNLKMEDLFIEQSFTIEENEEKIIENRFVHFNAKIECKGKLILRNCKVFYFEKNNEGICFSEGSKLEIVNCVMVDGRVAKNENVSYFKEYRSEKERFEHEMNIMRQTLDPHHIPRRIKEMNPFFADGKNYDVLIKNCIIDSCAMLVKCNNIQIVNCEIINCMGLVYAENTGNNSSVNKCYVLLDKIPLNFQKLCGNILLNISGGNFEENKFVEAIKEIKFDGLYFKAQEVLNCTFVGISAGLVAKKVLNSRFLNCTKGISGYSDVVSVMSECIFEGCSNCIDKGKWNMICCQFLDCFETLINAEQFSIESCQFYNCITDSKMINVNIYDEVWDSMMKKCVFNGIILKKADAYVLGAYDYGITEKRFCILLKQCSFSNCTKKDMNEANDWLIKKTCDCKEEIDFELLKMALGSAVVLRPGIASIAMPLALKSMKKKSMKNKSAQKELVYRIESTEGLESINLEGRSCNEYEKKEKDAFGKLIGVTENVECGISGEISNYIYQMDFAV